MNRFSNCERGSEPALPAPSLAVERTLRRPVASATIGARHCQRAAESKCRQLRQQWSAAGQCGQVLEAVIVPNSETPRPQLWHRRTS